MPSFLPHRPFRFRPLMLALMASTMSVGALAADASSPPRNPNETPAMRELYRQRFETLMANKGFMPDYSPMEPIRGAAKPIIFPKANAKTSTIAAPALEQAAAYARASNAQAFIVMRNGKIEVEQYFNGADAASPVVSKSLSKPLTAIAVGRALALGKIKSLDQPVTDFIPEWRGTDKAPMLVRHLLDMRSGLLEQMYSEDPDHPINRAYIDPDHGWHMIHNYPLTHKPGTYYGYGNAMSELVALVIERATGVRYGDFVSREVLIPIGAAGGEIWVDRPGGLAHSGCCMTLPAMTWLKLAKLLLDDGVAQKKRLLPVGYVSEMAKGTPENPHYGLGVWVAGPYQERRGFAAPAKPGPKVLHSKPYLDKDLFLFDGNSDQVVYVSRAANLLVLRVGATPPAKPEWDNTTLPNLILGNIRWEKGAKRPVPQGQ